jgi:hypothetical protein
MLAQFTGLCNDSSRYSLILSFRNEISPEAIAVNADTTSFSLSNKSDTRPQPVRENIKTISRQYLMIPHSPNS